VTDRTVRAKFDELNADLARAKKSASTAMEEQRLIETTRRALIIQMLDEFLEQFVDVPEGAAISNIIYSHAHNRAAHWTAFTVEVREKRARGGP